MRSLIFVLALALFAATITSALPAAEVDLALLNFPDGEFTAMLTSADISKAPDCPKTENSCGVVNFKSGLYTSFGQGTCMRLGSNAQSIYVGNCYCSLWK